VLDTEVISWITVEHVDNKSVTISWLSNGLNFRHGGGISLFPDFLDETEAE